MILQLILRFFTGRRCGYLECCFGRGFWRSFIGRGLGLIDSVSVGGVSAMHIVDYY
jgi:hypothetical protein